MAMYPNANVTEETEVIVTSMDYLTKVARIVATTDRTTMNSYIMWTLVRKYLPYLSSQYVSVVNSLEKELFGRCLRKAYSIQKFCNKLLQALTVHRHVGKCVFL